MPLSDLEIPPARSLSDFLLSSARFQIPNYKDLEKWGNRVVNNLLYYQTNYYIMTIIIFIMVTAFHPLKMFYGLSDVAIGYVIFHRYYNMSRTGEQHRNSYSLGILVIASVFFIIYILDLLFVFFVGILLPFCFIFVHSSLRLRSIKNKLSNKIEMIGLKKTPMGIFLESLGIEPEFIS